MRICQGNLRNKQDFLLSVYKYPQTVTPLKTTAVINSLHQPDDRAPL